MDIEFRKFTDFNRGIMYDIVSVQNVLSKDDICIPI